MRRNPPEPVERRRRLVEINLISERQSLRSQVRRSGCAQLLTAVGLGSASLGVIWLALH